MRESWIKDITIDDINEQYRYIAEEIGVDNFIKLTVELGGTTWYIPKIQSVLDEAMKRKVLKEYKQINGKSNRRELALKYGVSERTISRLISKNK